MRQQDTASATGREDGWGAFRASTAPKPVDYRAIWRTSSIIFLSQSTLDVPQTVRARMRDSLVQHALALINRDRLSHGVAPVSLGDNPAAQRHADEMLERDYISHWDLDGMKPYMRYTLAGGSNYEGENAFLSRVVRTYGPPRAQDPYEMLDDAEDGLMQSCVHRVNILNRWHRKVNIGIAHDDSRLALVQQFEGDYVRFHAPIKLECGALTLSGDIDGPFRLASIEVWYDQPPRPLALGQLDATRCYPMGQRPAAFIRRCGPTACRCTEASVFHPQSPIVDPYLVEEDAPRTSTCVSFASLRPVAARDYRVPWIETLDWKAEGCGFDIRADLTPALEECGPGVYTVLAMGQAGDEDERVALTNYSLFIE